MSWKIDITQRFSIILGMLLLIKFVPYHLHEEKTINLVPIAGTRNEMVSPPYH